MMHSQPVTRLSTRRHERQVHNSVTRATGGATLLLIASLVLSSCQIDKILSSGKLNDGNDPVDPPGGSVEPVPTRLAFDVQPINTQVGSAITPAMQVSAKDAAGSVVTGFTGDITIAITTNPSSGTLSGTTTRPAVAGVATFSGVSINNAGNGYRVTATSGSLTAATSSTFNITSAPPPPPNSLSIVSGNSQTATVGTALPNPYVVIVRNSSGTGVAGVTVSWSVVSGGGSIAATSVTNSSGQASATHTLGSTVGAQRVTATVAGATGSPVTFEATGTAAPVQSNTLSLVSGNSQSATVGTALANPYVVQLKNPAGQGVSGATVTWTVVSGGGSIAATSVTNSSGQASATHTLGSTVGNQRVTASVTGATGSPVTFDATGTAVPAPVATRIALVSGNSQTDTIGGTVDQPYIVRVTDAANNPVSGVVVNWSITAGTGGSLSAATSTTDATGRASVTHTLGTSLGNHTVTASVSGLQGSPVTFTSTATAGNPSRLVYTQQPTTAERNKDIKPPIKVTVQDRLGNVRTGTTTAISMSIVPLTGTPLAVLSGDTSNAPSAGTATFNNLRINLVGSGYRLRASSAGMSVDSNPFNITN